MDFDEIAMLRETARQWFQDKAPVSRFRALRNQDDIVIDREAWRGMSSLGWNGVAAPEAYGGAGLGVQASVVLAEECGRQLAAVPVVGALVGAPAALICGAGDVEKADLLPLVASGERTLLLALDSIDPAQPLTIDQLHHNDEATLRFVADVPLADQLIVPVATSGSEVQLFMVERQSAERIPRKLVDHRAYDMLRFPGFRSTAVAIGPAFPKEEFLGSLDLLYLASAAEMLGIIQRAFEITIEYLKTREQFGQLIGSFQALQHRAAQMLCQIEVLRSVIEHAARAADQNDPDLPAVAALAKALACEAARLVLAEALQFHGGIGMTDEHDIGLYFKRARVAEFLLGDAAAHRDRFAEIRGL